MKTHGEMRLAERVALASLLVSIVIALTKAYIFIVTSSVVVLAETVDSLGDILTSAIALLSVRFSRVPPDEDHPYGHEKIDSLFGALSSFLLIELEAVVLVNAMSSLLKGPSPPKVGNWVLIIFVSLSLINLVRSLYLWKAGKEEVSRTLRSEAINYGWDSGRTLLVAGLLVIAREFAPWVDPASALVITALVIPSTLDVFISSVKDLIDMIEPTILMEVRSVISSVKGIRSVKYVRARRVGGKLFVDSLICVGNHMRPEDIRRIHREVTAELEKRFGEVDVILSVTPPERHSSNSS